MFAKGECLEQLLLPLHSDPLYLSFIPHKEMLIPVVDDLDQLVADTLEPEQRGVCVEVGELLVKVGNGVISKGQICTDSIRPVKCKSKGHFRVN